MANDYVNSGVILGIDPGSSVMGLGAIGWNGRGLNYIGSGVLKMRRNIPLHKKLTMIHERVAMAIDEWSPESVAVERCFVGRNPRSALVLGQARGAAIAAAGLSGLVIDGYEPSVIKLAITRKSHADKDSVARGVSTILGIRTDSLSSHDESDALAIALCHALQTKNPQVIKALGCEKRVRKRKGRYGRR